MSSISDNINRLRQVAQEMFPNLTSGRRPFLSKINDIINNSSIKSGPIRQALFKSDTGPVMKLLSQSVILSNTGQRFGSRLSALEKLFSEASSPIPPQIPQGPIQQDLQKPIQQESLPAEYSQPPPPQQVVPQQIQQQVQPIQQQNTQNTNNIIQQSQSLSNLQKIKAQII